MTPRQFSDVLSALRDMRSYADKALNIAKDQPSSALVENEPYRFSVLYPLQIIGEAASRIPPTVRELAPDIPWKLIVGFRNVIVHEYGAIQMDTVQTVLDSELDRLIASLDLLIAEVEQRREEPLPGE